ncbi:MAG: hypothetical protein K6G83_04710 [Lachnospiraceae bacterium]|nr:hypothetical protein [Lachnospiraceae bacterium]
MKKWMTVSMMLLMLVVLSGYSGCHGPQYEESELEDMEARGRSQMQAWLDEHIPGATVATATAYINMIPSGPEYLTDSVYGTIQDGEEARPYEIEVEENEVYLTCDQSFLIEEMMPYTLEALNLSERADEINFTDFTAGILLPVENDWSQPEVHEVYMDNTCFLPGELVLNLEEAGYEIVSAAGTEDLTTVPEEAAETGEDTPESTEDTADTAENVPRIIWSPEAHAILDAFIRDPASRPELTLNGYLDVPEDIDLKLYDMAFFEGLRSSAGLYFSYVYLEQPYVDVCAAGWYTTYTRRTRQPFEDFFIEYTEERIVEECRNGTITEKEHDEYDVKNLCMERTEEGYGFSFTDPENWFNFLILSDENSELFQHEYTCRYDQAAIPGSHTYVGGRYIDREVVWEQREDGLWELRRTDDGAAEWFNNADQLLFREPHRQ